MILFYFWYLCQFLSKQILVDGQKCVLFASIFVFIIYCVFLMSLKRNAPETTGVIWGARKRQWKHTAPPGQAADMAT